MRGSGVLWCFRTSLDILQMFRESFNIIGHPDKERRIAGGPGRARRSKERMAEVAEGLAHLLKDTIPAIPTDAATRAKSGRRGLPMGPAVRAYLLWTRFLRAGGPGAVLADARPFDLVCGPRKHVPPARPSLRTGRPSRCGRPLPLRMQAAVIVLPVTTG